MKFDSAEGVLLNFWSPSIRREWIEIAWRTLAAKISVGLPPYGGSGLKSQMESKAAMQFRSPSIRREWIEMSLVVV